MRTILLIAPMLAMLAGCGTPPKAASLSRVQQLYAEGLDGAAAGAASVLVKNGAPGRREAAWYGGLAEFRQGHDAQARVLFKTAATSTEPQVAGGAEAMLGQLATRRAQYAEALKHFERAWLLLRGTDRRQTVRRAVAAAECSGNSQALDRWNGRLASGHAGSDAEAPNGTWVLQAGAYRNRTAADAHAARLTARASRAGIGPVTIRSRRDQGGIWWLVQCGGFGSRTEASAARRSMPGDQLIVARASP